MFSEMISMVISENVRKTDEYKELQKENIALKSIIHACADSAIDDALRAELYTSNGMSLSILLYNAIKWAVKEASEVTNAEYKKEEFNELLKEMEYQFEQSKDYFSQ